MKANEAPEKLFVNFHFIETHPESHQPLVTKQGINKYDIEYTRTDAFIEKADKFISSFFHPDDTELKNSILDEFHKYIKGE